MQNRKEVLFERLDGSLCWIAFVVVGRDKLVVHVFFAEVFQWQPGCFIVESDDICFEAVGFEAVATGFEPCQEIVFVSGFDCFSINTVGIIITHEENAFVASPGRDWAPTQGVHGNQVFEVIGELVSME